MREVLIEKVKRPDGRGLWGAYVVEQDEHGLWLYTPQGSTYRGTKDGRTATCTVGHPDPPGVPVLHLIPTTGWWFARWQVTRGVAAVSIDICTPATFHGRRWEYVDLELDLFKSSEGVVGIFDEDEFDEAVELGHISPDERSVCLDTAAQLDQRLRGNDPLLDDLAWARFEEVTKLLVPALVDLG